MLPPSYPLAGSTALAKPFGWDSRVALEACVRADLPRCQLFLNPVLGADIPAQEALVHQAVALKLSLTCHAPVNLDGPAFEPWMLDGFARLLARQDEKLVIVHVDDRIPMGRALEAVRKLCGAGFVAAVENWYPDPAPGRAPVASAYWLDLLDACRQEGLAAWPVFDIPRVFHRALAEPDGGLILSLLILDRLAALGRPLVLHLIDCLDADQAEDRWCSLGSGAMPYRELLARIEKRGLMVHHAVLEFSQEAYLAPSRDYLRAF